MAIADLEIIQGLVAPAVMISACGLLCLSTNARMMSVIGRLRTLHIERVAAYVDDPGENARKKRARDVRLEGLAWQSRHMLHRLNRMRWTMILLFSAILGMLLCSAFIGLGSLADELFAPLAVAAFALGGLCMAAAMINSILEMRIGLNAVRYEHNRILALNPDEPSEAAGAAPVRSAGSALASRAFASPAAPFASSPIAGHPLPPAAADSATDEERATLT